MHIKALVIGLTAIALAACAMQRTLPTVSASQPHGVVHGQLGQGANRTHPVQIIEINGVNVPEGGSNQFLLAPGDYTIRVRPTARLTTEIGSIGQRTRGGDEPRVLQLTVEQGVHYTVAAHVPGAHASDWQPVVSSERRR